MEQDRHPAHNGSRCGDFTLEVISRLTTQFEGNVALPISYGVRAMTAYPGMRNSNPGYCNAMSDRRD